jgi:proteic killer suppression protein
MLIRFADEQVRVRAISLERMVQEYGERKARRIRQRLDELDAASCLADVRTLPGMRCQSVNNQPGLIAICTISPAGIRLRADNDAYFDTDGALNWYAVTTIIIISLNENDYE